MSPRRTFLQKAGDDLIVLRLATLNLGPAARQYRETRDRVKGCAISVAANKCSVSLAIEVYF